MLDLLSYIQYYIGWYGLQKTGRAIEQIIKDGMDYVRLVELFIIKEVWIMGQTGRAIEQIIKDGMDYSRLVELQNRL